jgi:hypothetical protein
LVPHPGSIFANPFAIDKSAADPEAERDRVIKEFEKDIRKKLADDPSLQEKLLSLKGKVLGCWCHPEPCHADILLKLIGEFSSENSKKTQSPTKEESKEQESKVESVKEKPKNTIESQSLTKEETKVESVKEKAKKKVQVPKNTSRKQSKSSAKSDQTLESLLSKRKKKVK